MVSALSFWLFSSLSSVVWPATLPLRVRKIAQKYKAQIIPIYFFSVTYYKYLVFSLLHNANISYAEVGNIVCRWLKDDAQCLP